MKSNKPDNVTIEKRALELELSDVPRFWVGGNPVMTAYFNAISTVIPEGERFLMRSLSKAQKNMNDVALKKDVKHLIDQEASHLQAHMDMNKWLGEFGYPVRRYESKFRRWYKFAERRISFKYRLAFVAGLEYFFALLADQFLRQPKLLALLNPEMRKFFVWHFVEENEHKAVAFDVYQDVYGGYLPRALTFLFITLVFIPYVLGIQIRFLWKDKQLFNVRGWVATWKYCWFLPGWFTRMAPGYFRYLKPGFHPWNHDNSALLHDALEQYVLK